MKASFHSNNLKRIHMYVYVKPLIFPFLFLTLTMLNACNKTEECPSNAIEVNGGCECKEGYFGYNCEEADACILHDKHCANDGICVEGDCHCLGFWAGSSCEDYAPDALLGKYRVIETNIITANPCGSENYLLSAFEIRQLHFPNFERSTGSGSFTVQGKTEPEMYRFMYIGTSFDAQEEGTDWTFELSTDDQYEVMRFRSDCRMLGDTMRCDAFYYKNMRYSPNQCEHYVEFVAVREE